MFNPIVPYQYLHPTMYLFMADNNRFSASGQFEAAELIRNMITKPIQRQPDQTQLLLLQMSGDVHPKTGPDTKYHCLLCTRNERSRGVSHMCTQNVPYSLSTVSEKK